MSEQLFSQFILQMPGALAGFLTGMFGTWIATSRLQKEPLKQQLETIHIEKQRLHREITESHNEKQKLAKIVEDHKSNESKFRKTLKEKESIIQRTNEEVVRHKRQYQNVKTKLEESLVVKTYEQPVILVGPRNVGKTSLLMQWYSPWDSSGLKSTGQHSVSTVPIYKFQSDDLIPHFADDKIKVKLDKHLSLKVHDLPGELDFQERICQLAVSETKALMKQTNKNLGIVLICMFDATEARTGLTGSTLQYYNGDLFKRLRSMNSRDQIEIDKIVIVFNKYDMLKKHFENTMSDQELLDMCVERFGPCLELLNGVCDQKKVCEVFTILSRQDMHFNNQGAPIVRGEAARRFIKTLAGNNAAEDFIQERATNFSSKYFY